MIYLLENIDSLLTERRLLRGSEVVAWHVGRDLSGGKFSLDYVGSGEGMGALGPGVYFATSEDGALVYDKYVRDPWLYQVEIKTRGLYQHIDGKPTRLKEALIRLRDKLLPKHGVKRNGRLQLPAASRLNDGPHIIGNIFKALGAKEGRRQLIKAGIRGVYEPLPGGQLEICVYDTSIITFLDKKRLNGPDDYSDKKVTAEVAGFGYENSSTSKYGLRTLADALTEGLGRTRDGDTLSLYFQNGDGNTIGGVDYKVEINSSFPVNGGRGVAFVPAMPMPVAGDYYYGDIASAVADAFQYEEGKMASVDVVRDGEWDLDNHLMLDGVSSWLDGDDDKKGYLLVVKELERHQSSPAGTFDG